MLIVFVATQGGEPPELRDLHIRDSQSGADVPVAGLDGWDDDYLQVQTLTHAPLDFQDPETGKTGGSETQQYWCRRLSKLIVKINFNTSGANASIRPMYYDKDDALVVGDAVTVNAITRQESGAYMSPMTVFETYGANKMAVAIESVSSGTIDISLAGV